MGDYNLLGRPASRRLFLICLSPFYFPTDVVTYITALTADAGSSLLRLWLVVYSRAILEWPPATPFFLFRLFLDLIDYSAVQRRSGSRRRIYTEAIVSLSLIEKENVFSFSKME